MESSEDGEPGAKPGFKRTYLERILTIFMLDGCWSVWNDRAPSSIWVSDGWRNSHMGHNTRSHTDMVAR